MADPADRPFFVSSDDQIAYLRDKLRLPTKTWTDIWAAMHARAFVIAGATSEALLADFHEAVTAAIAEGKTLADFRKDFDRIVAAHGWTHKGSAGWRSKVIYQTNMRMAWSAGRWAEAQRVKADRPYLRYVAVLDARTRPQHREWNGTLLSIDDDWWKTHMPPNGWNCRCTVQTLSARDIERWGLKVSAEAPAIEWTAERIRSGGETITVTTPKGIDPGFAYNAGEAGFGRGQESLAQEAHGPWEALDAGPTPAVATDDLPADAAPGHRGKRVKKGDEAGLREALRRALGGDEVTLTDPVGGRVVLGQAIVDHMLAKDGRWDWRERFFDLLPGVVTDPAEIWIGWAKSQVSGRVALRRRYVRLYALDKTTTFAVVADADGGMWSGLTFFRGGPTAISGIRTGLRIWKRD